jgi:peptidoglycan/xylan/chitin deacetylase (PgdA/CDA1 family)
MAELVAEVEVGADIIERLTSARPAFFRSGTAFADNVAVCAIGDMGYRFIGFSIAADDGATLSRNAVKQRILSAQHGDILLLHFNSKNSETHLGFMMALEELKQKKECVRFEKLSDFSDKLEAY